MMTPEEYNTKHKTHGVCSKCGEWYEHYKYDGIMIPLCKECRYGFFTGEVNDKLCTE
jgi:hypothetical protein